MKTLYLNPYSGIAGDMLVGALLDLGADTADFWRQLQSLPLPASEWKVARERVNRHGVEATRFVVTWRDFGPAPEHGRGRGLRRQAAVHDHHGRHLPEILTIIAGAELPALAKERARRAFEALAEAEAKVHGIPPEQVHFHEVGAVDAIVDIVGACLAATLLGTERVVCGPVHVGSGTVTCAHGVMPVPVPAVANLLRDVPTVVGSAKGELTTPTGAALLRGLEASFAAPPAGALLASGYGAGTKDLPDRANVLAALLLEVTDAVAPASPEQVAVIECNLDDAPGEQLGHLVPRLLAAGALDVALIPCTMKKGRPGIILHVLAPPTKREAIGELMLRETTTFGVRWHLAERMVLRREIVTVETAAGPVEVKLGYLGADQEPLRYAPEYESCRRAAEASGLPLADVYELARQAARARGTGR